MANAQACFKCYTSNELSVPHCWYCCHRILAFTRHQLWNCQNCKTHNTGYICKKCEKRRPIVRQTPTVPTLVNGKGEYLNQNGEEDEEVIKDNDTPPSHSREIRRFEATCCVEAIIKSCKERNILFEDMFSPIVGSFKGDGYRKIVTDDEISWLRPDDIFVPPEDLYTEWCLLERVGSETYLHQGGLGNCGLVSMFILLAKNRQLLNQIFLTDALNPQGVYALRLCKDGLWTVMIIDDRLPCYSNNRRMAFTRARRNELWVPLLERAFAKLFGCYQYLTELGPPFAASILTGYPSIRDTTSHIKRVNQIDRFWAFLWNIQESGSMATIETKTTQSDAMDTLGVFSNHCYALLEIAEPKDDLCLIYLQDPFIGYVSERGWSDDSPYWNGLEEADRKRMNIPGSNSRGRFWISLEDMLRVFGRITICMNRDQWKVSRTQNSFPNGADRTLEAFRMTIKNQTEIDLRAYSRYSRHLGVAAMLDSFIFIEDENHRICGKSPWEFHSTATLSTVLEPGRYRIYCFSFSRWRSANEIPYVLACHSDQIINLRRISLHGSAMARALINYGMREGKKIKLKDQVGFGVVSLLATSDHEMLIAFNTKRETYCSVDYKMHDDTKGMRCLFGDEFSGRVIPPRHSQIINILTEDRTVEEEIWHPYHIDMIEIPTPNPSSFHIPDVGETLMDVLKTSWSG